MKRFWRALSLFRQEDLRTILWILGVFVGSVLLVTIIRSSGFVILSGVLSRHPEQKTQFLVAIIIPSAVFLI
jgi:hypothetical protein